LESGASSPVRSGSVQSSPSPRTTGLTYTNNPQFVEEQAIDRVHRLTQTVDVVVYKLTVRGTVEERILALQEHVDVATQRILPARSRAGGKPARSKESEIYGRRW